MSTFPLTSSQTVGPFFSPALLREDARRNVLIQPETAGERMRIEGRVLDGLKTSQPTRLTRSCNVSPKTGGRRCWLGANLVTKWSSTALISSCKARARPRFLTSDGATPYAGAE